MAFLFSASAVVTANEVRTFVVDSSQTSLQFSGNVKFGENVVDAIAQGPGSLQTTATGSISGVNVTSDVGNYFQILSGSVVTLVDLPGTWLPFSEPANFAFSLGIAGAVRGLAGELGGHLKITTGGVVDSGLIYGTTLPGSRLDALDEQIDVGGVSLFNAAPNGTFAIDGRDFVLTLPVNMTATEVVPFLGDALTLSGTMTGQIQARSVNALAAQFSWKSTTAGDFNDPNNWTGGVVPGPGMVANFELPMEVQFPRELVQQWQENVATLAQLNITAGRLVLAPTPPGGFGLVEGDWPDSIQAETVVIGRPGELVIGSSVNMQAPNGVTNEGVVKGNGKVSGNITNSPKPGQLTISVAPGESVGHFTADDMVFDVGTGLEIELNDAQGLAGKTDGGWDLLTLTNSLDFLGTSNDPMLLKVVSLDLLNQPGETTNFNPLQSYHWKIAEAGQINGFAPDAFVIDTSDFQNEFNGTFSLYQEGNELWLAYHAVPEPGTLTLAGLALGLAPFMVRRRSWNQPPASRLPNVLSRLGLGCLIVCVFILCASQHATAANITIDTVPIGNAGNAPDPLTGNLYGAVSYEYRIGKTEVTNAQYAAFLNEKAKSDPLGLYSTSMGSNIRGGITRSGSDGSYTYSTKPNMADKPVNYVSWYDAVRFTNWLHNGQGSGDTETGAYTILGGTATPSNGPSITRNAGAKWWLPSEDEWYKAAYYDPTLNSGAGGYWLYPTQSNTYATVATANSVGDISNPGANVANYFNGAIWNSVTGNVTTVGSAGPLSDSFYGTADQGGNVNEWNEGLFSGSLRLYRGGSWKDIGEGLQQSLFRSGNLPGSGLDNFGFRVATAIPEPSSYALALSALIGLALFARRIRR